MTMKNIWKVDGDADELLAKSWARCNNETKRTKIVLSQELKNKEKKVVLNSVLMVNKESLLKEYDNTINNTFKYNN
jgi:hypothetical protein